MAKFKFNMSPGIVVSTLGFGGLVFSLIDNTGEIGSKIPLTVFFLFIMGVGIAFEMYSQNKHSDVYGEFGEGREYA